jgi:hypothetical protein
MTFVYPTFLWALLAISIPVIIHLFNFRRYKKVYFTNVRFLRELQHESKSKSRLKEILILLSRCLAIACLVLAFCQPVVQDQKAGKAAAGANAVSIYIDNSFSMDNVQKQGPLLDIARMDAQGIVKAYGGADKFQIITNDFEGKHQRFYSREDVLSKIDEIKISSAVRNYSDVIKRQYEFLNSSGIGNKKIYSLTDAQRSTFDIGKVNEDSSIKTILIPLKANQVNNVYVDTCWFETPLQQKGFIQKLHAVVVNMGNNPVNSGSAKLFVNKQQLAISSFSIDSYSKKEIQFSFECKQSGFNYGSIKIDDYPVTFDDELFFSFNSKINIGVCLLSGKDLKESNAFEALFKGDSLFNFYSYNEQSVDFSKFKSCDVVVLNQLTEISSGILSEVSKFVNNGGSAVIVPAANSNITSYNTLLSALQLPAFTQLDTSSVKTEKIETGGKFYTGVFEKIEDRLNLPVINRHFRVNAASKSDFETILTLQNSDPLMGFVHRGNGSVYLITAPLDQRSSNFSKHALFVPTIYRVCFGSLKSSALFYEVNSNNVLSIRNEGGEDDRPPHIRSLSGKADIIPEIHPAENNLLLYTRSQISTPGFYEIVKNNDSLLPLAFNYSRKESDLRCYTKEEIDRQIADRGLRSFRVMENTQQDISKLVAEEAQGKKLWKLFIILALSFIIIEILLLRFLK